MIDGKENNIGCFICGETMPEFYRDEEGFAVCLACHKRGIVSFQEALDLLNEFRLAGHVIIYDPEQQEDIV